MDNDELDGQKEVFERDYDQATYKQFIRDMRKAGLCPYHYDGRFFYHGPAVDVDDTHAAIRATKVKVQIDGMGLGFVVYPQGY
jgi:hypothetical protein